VSDSSTELLFRVNGIQAAFGIEFGFDSPRANEGRALDPYRQANVSFSLVQRRGNEIVRHTLIDVGMGVVPSLLDFERTHGVHVVHEVFLTHPHLDHFAQLDWLSMAVLRNMRTDQPRPLQIYASRACWEEGPTRVFQHLTDKSEFRSLEPGLPVRLGDLTLTPFAVDHKASAPGALGFVAEHGGRKVVMTGDFMRIVDAGNGLLLGADAAFFDSNTWHPAEQTGHHSVLDNLRLVEAWRPKRAYMIHYSGYEDRDHPGDAVSGPLGAERFREEINRVSGSFDVQLARHGMILGDDTAWPD
jgi:ribonuclease BN (tRNA processing enzyme)